MLLTVMLSGRHLEPSAQPTTPCSREQNSCYLGQPESVLEGSDSHGCRLCPIRHDIQGQRFWVCGTTTSSRGGCLGSAIVKGRKSEAPRGADQSCRVRG